MPGIVLVLGASGLFGSRVAEAFTSSGWTVRRYRRGSDMASAAMGADLIVNALNPPMYHDWARLIPAITDQVIAAGLASGATVLVPGNVYVYGDQPGPWGPDTPHHPRSRKGQIRTTMEASYRKASLRGLRVIILRGGDFLDAAGKGAMMNAFILRSLKSGKITIGGGADVQRAYANLTDMAQVAVALADRRATLPAFADIPFAGLTFSMRDFKIEMERQLGRPLHVSNFPWWIMRLAVPFWELARELPEMRYLFDTPHALDAGPLQALLPDLKIASLADIVTAHLNAFGLLASGQVNINPNRAVA